MEDRDTYEDAMGRLQTQEEKDAFNATLDQAIELAKHPDQQQIEGPYGGESGKEYGT